jgi:FAD/FMN-containing dehydrogenase
VAEIKAELIKIVGAANVRDDPAIIESYSRDYSFAPANKPRVVVRPQNSDQVQMIVRWANENGLPLIPVSSGPPHFHGDTVPSVEGAVIVELFAMNRILKIDRRNRMALIEPGVTYPQLQPELAKHGLKLSMPLLPRANKSVVASLLEREPITTPKYQWTLLEPLRCLEIVWGDGERLRTGDAGTQFSVEQAWAVGQAPIGPAGPGQTDFHRFVSGAQGSMGIVTWATLKCEILPSIHNLFLVPNPNLEGLIDFLYTLLKFRLGDELLLLNNFNLASILRNKSEPISVLSGKLPQWVALVGVAGRSTLPAERVEFQTRDIEDIAQNNNLQLKNSLAGEKEDAISKMFFNASPEPYWKLRYAGGYQDILFLSTLDRMPEFVRTMLAVAAEFAYPASQIGVYIQPLHQGASCHCEFSLPFAENNPQEVARIQALYTKASRDLQNQGAYFSRPYGAWSALAYGKDAHSALLLKKVKQIFDPNGVMNPGKLCFSGETRRR